MYHTEAYRTSRTGANTNGRSPTVATSQQRRIASPELATDPRPSTSSSCADPSEHHHLAKTMARLPCDVAEYFSCVGLMFSSTPVFSFCAARSSAVHVVFLRRYVRTSPSCLYHGQASEQSGRILQLRRIDVQLYSCVFFLRGSLLGRPRRLPAPIRPNITILPRPWPGFRATWLNTSAASG